MADEYTPTTEDVREAWAKRNALYRSTSLASIGYRAHIAVNDARYSAEDYAEFTRWLAAHDREVAAKALRDAADEAQQGFVDEQQGIGFARVRTDWLRARADRIELQASEKGAGDGEQ